MASITLFHYPVNVSSTACPASTKHYHIIPHTEQYWMPQQLSADLRQRGIIHYFSSWLVAKLDDAYVVHYFVNMFLFFSHVLVFGDFNVDFLNAIHPLSSKLCNIFDSFSFVQLVSQPTHVASSGSATLIDLVPSSSLDYVQDCSVIPPLDTKNHRGIRATIKWHILVKPKLSNLRTSGNML